MRPDKLDNRNKQYIKPNPEVMTDRWIHSMIPPAWRNSKWVRKNNNNNNKKNTMPRIQPRNPPGALNCKISDEIAQPSIAIVTIVRFAET